MLAATPSSITPISRAITAPRSQLEREAWKYSPLERYLPQGEVRTGTLQLNVDAQPFTAEISDEMQLAESLTIQAAAEGQHIDVAANTRTTLTIHNRHDAAGTTANHLHLTLGTHAEVTLIETHEGNTEGRNLYHITVELADGAQLTHLQLNNQYADVAQLISVRASMARNSRYHHWYGALAGGFKRLDFHPIVEGEGAEFTSHGLFLAANQDVHDHYFPILHPKNRSASNIHYRGVLADKAKGIIYSRAEVPPHAAGNEAHQHAKALLLGERAQAMLRPELAIDCDDVICSHGAATGMLDAEALHYLQARGLTALEAKQLLVEAFVGEILEALPEHTEDANTTIRNAVEQWLEAHA